VTRRRSRALAALAALVALVLSGCAGLPGSGPLHAGPSQPQPDDLGIIEYTPGGPKPGATRAEIVRGFLEAMTATPLSTFVARQFLTGEASSGWVPEQRTLVYGGYQLREDGRTIAVRMTDIVALDGRGEWLGDPSDGRGVTSDLTLVKERGEWRIADPPDELVIPRSHFEARYIQLFLYFFDKSSQVLVPEPVYVPRGAQAPTLLVAGLLRGPRRDLLGVERTFIPARTELGDISVPVSRDGTAEVPLTDEVLDLDDERLNLVFAQLAWTLEQVPGIERMRITVDGSPLDLPGQRADTSVAGWSELDPAVAWASQSLFGLRDGRAVVVGADDERRVAGVFGSVDLGLRSIGVDLPAKQIAGVTRDGRSVLTAPRDRVNTDPPTAQDAKLVYSGGTDLLPPVYDLYDQLWLVDDTRGGAVLSVVREGTARRLQAPGISGHRVSAFLLSRDGTRLVAQLDEPGADRLVLARVRRDQTGEVRGILAAKPLDLAAAGVDRIRDLAWRTPGSVAVLGGRGRDVFTIAVEKVDGSQTLGDVAPSTELFGDQAVQVVTSPTPGTPLYLGTRSRRLFVLSSTGRWTASGIEPGLRAATFVG
jgi:hypothetical protein